MIDYDKRGITITIATRPGQRKSIIKKPTVCLSFLSVLFSIFLEIMTNSALNLSTLNPNQSIIDLSKEITVGYLTKQILESQGNFHEVFDSRK